MSRRNTFIGVGVGAVVAASAMMLAVGPLSPPAGAVQSTGDAPGSLANPSGIEGLRPSATSFSFISGTRTLLTGPVFVKRIIVGKSEPTATMSIRFREVGELQLGGIVLTPSQGYGVLEVDQLLGEDLIAQQFSVSSGEVTVWVHHRPL